VIPEPQIQPYSRQARICLGIAVAGAIIFVAGLLMTFL